MRPGALMRLLLKRLHGLTSCETQTAPRSSSARQYPPASTRLLERDNAATHPLTDECEARARRKTAAASRLPALRWGNIQLAGTLRGRDAIPPAPNSPGLAAAS